MPASDILRRVTDDDVECVLRYSGSNFPIVDVKRASHLLARLLGAPINRVETAEAVQIAGAEFPINDPQTFLKVYNSIIDVRYGKPGA